MALNNKKALPQEVQDLLAEAEGRAPSKARKTSTRVENHAKSGGAVPPVPVKKPKRLTDAVKTRFASKARRHQAILAQQEGLKAELKTVKEELSGMALKHGVALLERPKERVLYHKGYKAQIEWKVTSGAIESEVVMEWARKKDPGMIDHDKKSMLDLIGLDQMLGEYNIPADKLAEIRRNLTFVTELVRKEKPALLEETDEEILNLEKYRDAKDAGRVPSDVVERAETQTGHYALAVHELVDKERCSCCGHPRPKNKKNAEVLSCTKCGHQEKK